MNDINPRRTIRDIPVPPSRREKVVEPEIYEEEEVAPPPPPPRMQAARNDMRVPPRKVGFSKTLMVVVGIMVLGLLALLGSQFLSERAVVSVVQKTRDVSLNGSFMAKKNATSTDLAFDTISAAKDASKTIPATGDKQVETRSTGTIVIYNNYSSAPQRLIKNTRFETTDGHIFRIDESVTVPGKDTSTGAPGSVEATVFADAAGADYNIGLSDFTIPGFKSDPRYSKFFARSKTVMSGGFIGSIKTAAPADLAKAKSDTEASLKADLIKNLQSQVPQGMILFPNSIFVQYQLISPPDSNELKEHAVAYGVIFDSKKIGSAIAAATVGDYDPATGAVEASPIENLTFTSVPADAKPWETGTVSFSLSGTTTITWQFDADKLRNDLAGQMKDKSRIATILQAYPSIDHAEVVVRPFWKSTLPKDPEKINIAIEKDTAKK
jgi:hypothetical protein